MSYTSKENKPASGSLRYTLRHEQFCTSLTGKTKLDSRFLKKQFVIEFDNDREGDLLSIKPMPGQQGFILKKLTKRTPIEYKQENKEDDDWTPLLFDDATEISQSQEIKLGKYVFFLEIEKESNKAVQSERHQSRKLVSVEDSNIIDNQTIVNKFPNANDNVSLKQLVAEKVKVREPKPIVGFNSMEKLLNEKKNSQEMEFSKSSPKKRHHEDKFEMKIHQNSLKGNLHNGSDEDDCIAQNKSTSLSRKRLQRTSQQSQDSQEIQTPNLVSHRRLKKATKLDDNYDDLVDEEPSTQNTIRRRLKKLPQADWDGDEPEKPQRLKKLSKKVRLEDGEEDHRIHNQIEKELSTVFESTKKKRLRKSKEVMEEEEEEEENKQEQKEYKQEPKVYKQEPKENKQDLKANNILEHDIVTASEGTPRKAPRRQRLYIEEDEEALMLQNYRGEQPSAAFVTGSTEQGKTDNEDSRKSAHNPNPQLKRLRKLVEDKRNAAGKQTANKVSNSQSEVSKETCSICISELTEETGHIDGCKHVFCFSCVSDWANFANECPLCRIRFNQIVKYSKDNVKLETIPVKFKNQNNHSEWEEVLVDDEAEDHCYICEQEENPDVMMICDRCEYRCCHIYCCDPPLSRVPEDEWICTFCKEEIEAEARARLNRSRRRLQRRCTNERGLLAQLFEEVESEDEFADYFRDEREEVEEEDDENEDVDEDEDEDDESDDSDESDSFIEYEERKPSRRSYLAQSTQGNRNNHRNNGDSSTTRRTNHSDRAEMNENQLRTSSRSDLNKSRSYEANNRNALPNVSQTRRDQSGNGYGRSNTANLSNFGSFRIPGSGRNNHY